MVSLFGLKSPAVLCAVVLSRLEAELRTSATRWLVYLYGPSYGKYLERFGCVVWTVIWKRNNKGTEIELNECIFLT